MHLQAQQLRQQEAADLAQAMKGQAEARRAAAARKRALREQAESRAGEKVTQAGEAAVPALAPAQAAPGAACWQCCCSCTQLCLLAAHAGACRLDWPALTVVLLWCLKPRKSALTTQPTVRVSWCAHAARVRLLQFMVMHSSLRARM